MFWLYVFIRSKCVQIVWTVRPKPPKKNAFDRIFNAEVCVRVRTQIMKSAVGEFFGPFAIAAVAEAVVVFFVVFFSFTFFTLKTE